MGLVSVLNWRRMTATLVSQSPAVPLPLNRVSPRDPLDDSARGTLEMKSLSVVLTFAAIFGCGYLCGSFQGLQPESAAAQEQIGVEEISNDTLIAYLKFRKACSDLGDSLTAESLNVPATEDVNYFALSVGGLDAIRDLEEGRGVDPETFAAIYADRANPSITQHLDTDDLGRVRYKGTVVRMYSRERLREIFQRRDQIVIRASRND
jgi:hypothetical protein